MKNKQCRMCASTNIVPFLNMGKQPLVNSLLSKEDLNKKEEVYNLTVSFCKNCGLIQIVDPISAKKIYQDVDYLYFSSDMPGLKKYFEDYIDNSIAKYITNYDDLIVEIGSNDGILLDILKEQHVINSTPRNTRNVLGVDPATNVVLRALKKGIPTIPAFFTAKLAQKIVNEYGQASVMVANNCIAHLYDLGDLLKGVNILLKDNGKFIIEANYWGGMVNNTNYSLIYHDHFSYFSFNVWNKFLKKFEFELTDAMVTEAQGGSMRITIGRKGKHKISDNVKDWLAIEESQKINSLKTCRNFAKQVKDDSKKLNKLVKEVIKKGGKIAAYGAAAKGFTILNMAELTNKEMVCCIDDSPAKQGKYVPLNHIPIVSREEANKYNFDYIIILPWNYRDIIMEKEKDFKNKGGKFIIPVGDIGII